MKYLIILIVLLAGCRKDDIKPLEVDKGKADSVYASKIINPKLK